MPKRNTPHAPPASFFLYLLENHSHFGLLSQFPITKWLGFSSLSFLINSLHRLFMFSWRIIACHDLDRNTCHHVCHWLSVQQVHQVIFVCRRHLGPPSPLYVQYVSTGNMLQFKAVHFGLRFQAKQIGQIFNDGDLTTDADQRLSCMRSLKLAWGLIAKLYKLHSPTSVPKRLSSYLSKTNECRTATLLHKIIHPRDLHT